ncbi:MAG TPA: glycosyltransferase [Candidatus Aminicenantes bacterium]|nr:glycosyltransferase [Candidatus Aminicenantes bacterium]
MKRIELFEIGIDNISMEETFNVIEQLIKKKKPSLVVTPNVHHINILKNDDEFKKIYRQASMALPDSTPLIWASKLLGTPLKEKVAGSDLLPSFCKIAARKRYELFFLGSGPSIAKKAANILTKKYPGLKIVGTYSPPFGFENDEDENRKIVAMIKKCTPDVLFVGLGPPKQEKWIWRYKDEINVPVSIAVGASFDFVAGNVKRAPKWMQHIGFEWFFRLCQEPRRLWKRYLVGNIMFLWLVLKEFIKSD